MSSQFIQSCLRTLRKWTLQDNYKMIFYPLVQCWICVLRKGILNNETWVNQPYTETRNADYGICNEKGCLELFKRFRKSLAGCRACPASVIRSLESYVKSIRPPYSHGDIGVLENNTFQYIMDWKIHQKFNIRVFIALLDWAITPFMLENFTTMELTEHAVRMCTIDHSGWEYFQLDDNDIDTIIRAKVVNEAPLEIDCDVYARLPFKSRIPVIVEDMKSLTQRGVKTTYPCRRRKKVVGAALREWSKRRQ